MSIPKYDELYMTMLQAMSDGKIHTLREVEGIIASRIGITEDERQQVSAHGTLVFHDRVSWTCSYLKHAQLLEHTGRSRYCLTDEGKRVLANPPASLDNRFLYRYPSFRAFMSGRNRPKSSGQPFVPDEIPDKPPEPDYEDETPNERIEQAYAELNEALSENLLSEIASRNSDFFGRLVFTLLLRMGYGGIVSDSRFQMQKSGEDGVDGVIRKDPLGFEQIYIRAKNRNPASTITISEILRFSGALQIVKASGGLFITTAKFSDDARIAAQQEHVVLVDGPMLAELMAEYNVGVSTVAKYEIKAIDSDFFTDEKA